MVEPKGSVPGDSRANDSGDLVPTSVDCVTKRANDSGDLVPTSVDCVTKRANDSGDLVPTSVDCVTKQTADESEMKEMHMDLEIEKTMNLEEGTGIANVLFTQGFVLEQQDSGMYVLFGPNSRHPLIEFCREKDFYIIFNKLEKKDVVALYPEYESALCEIVGTGSQRVLEEPMGIEGKRKGSEEVVTRGRKKGMKKTVSRKGKRTHVPVCITPEIRSSLAIVEMVLTWLMDKCDLSMDIEKSLQSIRQSKSVINNSLESIRHHRDSVAKKQKSLLYFDDKVSQAIASINEAKGVIVSSVPEYQILKPYLTSDVKVYCHPNSRRKDEICDAVCADNRTFSTYVD